MHRDGEPEPRVHAPGVVPDRGVEELPDVGELLDRVELALGLGRVTSRAGLRDRPVLGRLIGIEPARFADEFWARSALLTTAAELDRSFDDLFSLEVADEILSTRGLRTPFIRVAKDGAIVDSSRFTGPGGVGASVGDQVSDDRILDLFASGHTLVLQALHRFWPPLVAFAGALGHRARPSGSDQRVHHAEAVAGVLGPLRRP